MTVEKNKYGFYSVIKKPSEEELGKYYADMYYQEQRGSYEKAYSDDELNYFGSRLRLYYHTVQKYLFKNESNGPISFLDIGCGEGWALSYFDKLGWDITGLDYSNFGVQKFNPHMVDKLIVGNIYESIDGLISSGKQFDVIWLVNVLEHVLDPESLIEKIKEILNPNGILLVQVPNDFSEIQKYLIDNATVDREYWVVIPDHLSYFNYDGLVNLMNAYDYHKLTLMADFPIDWQLFNSESNYIKDKTKGKAAHFQRLALEKLLSEQPVENVASFYTSLAEVGHGRNLVGFFKKD